VGRAAYWPFLADEVAVAYECRDCIENFLRVVEAQEELEGRVFADESIPRPKY
jgi:hypothetical protein